MPSPPSDKLALILVWFRQDLRLTDNLALLAPHEKERAIFPLYILDDINSGDWAMGGASRWWLYHSLSLSIIETTAAQSVFWNRCYEPWQIERDAQIKSALTNLDLGIESLKAWKQGKNIAGVTLGKDCPHPIVELKPSRERALEAINSLSAYKVPMYESLD